MDEGEWLADRFEAHRTDVRAVAHRTLGSLSEADDAVHESWLHLSRSDTSGIENVGGWTTTIVLRVCLDMLRSHKLRREEPLGAHLLDPIVSFANGTDPEHEASPADSVGLALLVIFKSLAPAERIAFVLHDMLALPFDNPEPGPGNTPTQRAEPNGRRGRGLGRFLPVTTGHVSGYHASDQARSPCAIAVEMHS